jgi:hypothetical protein
MDSEKSENFTENLEYYRKLAENFGMKMLSRSAY